jgi:hypothetical protein
MGKYQMVSNKDLKSFIKECAKYFVLPETHFNYVKRTEVLKDLIEEIQTRIDYEENTDRSPEDQMAYEIVKEVVLEEDGYYYDSDALKTIKKIAQDTLLNKKYTENFI